MANNSDNPREPLWLAPVPLAEDGSKRIRSVFIANRGEIACRVISTCRKLQIRSIAVYADEDASSRHVHDADDAFCLGSMERPEGNPFLDVHLLVDTAVRAGADAIHPGYGYLSENAQFADAVRQAGILFIGPTSTAISTLGDKREAKEYLARHEPSIPLIPGYTGSGQGVQRDSLERESLKIGFPVMIKASAGGGGRGLRIVRDTASLTPELERAQSEAQRSFGLADCILEKYIEAGKHVEVQIVGDRHGHVISLGERDCSVQRRHQKVIEETPCTWLAQATREAMCAAAVRIGKLLRYEGAGTVEFIVDVATGRFYFLEVNARLQVEHPITEEVTGLDMVSLQLFVAAGGRLASLERLRTARPDGHAIECRLCAEDPARGFAPQHGVVRLWRPADMAEAVRFETAVGTGARVSIYFDSMIAKVVVWAPSRAMAVERMAHVLANTVCLGITTNQLFLQACLLHPAFRDPGYTTSFIPAHMDALLRSPYTPRVPEDLLSVMPVLFLRHIRRQAQRATDRGVFGTISSGFRNQRFDRVNRPCDIVALFDLKQGAITEPQVCLWESEWAASVAPVPADPGPPDEALSGAAAVTKAYNTLSRCVRSGHLPGACPCMMAIHSLDSQPTRAASIPSASWVTGHVTGSVNQQKVAAYMATDNRVAVYGAADTGGASRVFCHFPALGAPVEYRCFTVLSYFEAQRRAVDSGPLGDAGTIKAPMPCKVLQLLKKDGSQVKTGEVVMIVESMKMEISISAERDGAFHCSLREGEAVNEGSLLCTLS